MDAPMLSDYEKRVKSFEAMADLQRETDKLSSKRTYVKAYILSFALPPIGIYYFIKYLFFTSGADGDKKAAVYSLAITIFSLLLNIWLVGALFKTTLNSTSIPTELITPANQKDLIKLFQ